jgi:acyl-CoA reductase-like NAD-dependent aldehyde dehydrogenase
MMTFRTPEEAFARANIIPYGLSAGVWTDKGSKIFKMVNKLRGNVVLGLELSSEQLICRCQFQFFA